MTSCVDYRQGPILIPESTFGLRWPSRCPGAGTPPGRGSRSTAMCWCGGGSALCKHVLWAVLASHPRSQGEAPRGRWRSPDTARKRERGGAVVVARTASLWSCRQSHFTKNRWPGQACTGAGLETGRRTAASCYFPVVTAALGGRARTR